MPKIEDQVGHIEPLLSVDDLCDLFKVHRNTVYRWLREKTFPQPKKVGRSFRWRLSVVKDWIESEGDE